MTRINGIELLPPRVKTLVLATSDASVKEKAQADDVLTGTNDYIKIQAAIDALGSYDSLEIVGENVVLGATGITIAGKEFFRFRAPAVAYSGTGVAIAISGTNIDGLDIVVDYILATGDAVSSGTARAFTISGINTSKIKSYIDAFKAGAGLELITVAGTTIQNESNDITLTLMNVKTSILFSGDYSSCYNTFDIIWYISDGTITNLVCFDTQSNTGAASGNRIKNIAVWPNTDSAVSIIKGNNHSLFIINKSIVDAATKGGALVFFDTTVLTDRMEESVWWNAAAAAKMWNTKLQYVGYWIREGVVQASTGKMNSDEDVVHVIGLGATTGGTNGGGGSSNDEMYCNTTVASGSTGYIRTKVALSVLEWMDWDIGILEWIFYVNAYNCDANTEAWVKLCSGLDYDDLASHGLGIHIINAAVYGQSYGSGAAAVDTATLGNVDPSASVMTKIRIVYIPGVHIAWRLNDGTAVLQATAANLPTTDGNARIILSVANGAGIKDQTLYTNRMRIRQK